MFIGHFAVALAAKRAAPRVSLGILFAASQLIDLVWPVFLLLGWERVRIAPGDTAFTPLDFEHFPWTHSLAAVLVWSVVATLSYTWLRKDRGGAIVVGMLVASHWLLDFVTHRADLPLYPGDPRRVGLGLWRSVPATLLLESLLFLGGVLVYASATRATDRTGRLAWWTLVVFLVVIHLANAFGPPPPSVGAVAWAGLAAWLIPFWAAWADRHRIVLPRDTPAPLVSIER